MRSKILKWPDFVRPFLLDPGPPVRLWRAGIGDIDGFINAYLTASANGTLKK